MAPEVPAHRSAHVAEAYSPPRLCPRARAFGLLPGYSIDLSTEKPGGGCWDLSREEDREAAKELQQRVKPWVLVGSPPCDPFSQLQRLNDARRMPEQRQEVRQRGLLHLRCAVAMYRRQMQENRYFLHEHPSGADSWQEEEIRDLMRTPGVVRAEGPMCAWGMSSVDSQGPALQ